MPILALPFQGGIESRERAFHMGADDFMEKPLELRECLVRAQALLRRYNAAAPPLPGQRRCTIVNLATLLVDPMTRLRQKLDGGSFIESVRGVGYRRNDPTHKKK